MSHQERKIIVNHQTIKQVIDWLLPVALFSRRKVRKGATWKLRMLAAAALLWAAAGPETLADRFQLARRVVEKVFRGNPAPGTSYQGFMKTLRKWHAELRSLITSQLRERMRETLPEQWEIGGHVLLASDGSRGELARTAALEEAFSPKRKKKKKKKPKKGAGGKAKSPKRKKKKKQSAASIAKKTSSPQIWLTLLWHVGGGQPWAWRTGPTGSSEREHLTEMLAELPKSSLITADAGFIGYEFWQAILSAGHNFVIRVGGNVRLLKNLGCARQHEHTIYLWPDSAAKKNQPPLALRLIVIHNGKHPVYLVTNLVKSKLSDRQAGEIYAARWGIELYFRTFKQTFGRRKLRSHSAANATLELDWSLLGMWCIGLLGQRALAAAGTHPSRLSAAAAIKAFQRTVHDYRVRPESPHEDLWSQLAVAVKDDYTRTSSKTSRKYPRKKAHHAIGHPTITPASQQQITAAKELKQQHVQFRLPA